MYVGIMVKLDYQQASIKTPISRYIKYSLNKIEYSKISCPQDFPYLWQVQVYGYSNKKMCPQINHPQYRPNNK